MFEKKGFKLVMMHNKRVMIRFTRVMNNNTLVLIHFMLVMMHNTRVMVRFTCVIDCFMRVMNNNTLVLIRFMRVMMYNKREMVGFMHEMMHNKLVTINKR